MERITGPHAHHPPPATSAGAPVVDFPDQHLFDTLVERHYAPLFRFALHLCRNNADAKDVVQETFRRLATHGHQIKHADAAKTWLYTVAYRAALDRRKWLTRWFRQESFEPTRLTTDQLPAHGSDPAIGVDAQTVLAALHKLPERHRAPLSLFYLQDLTYDEIAEVLGVPIGTVMSRLHRGRQSLAASLGIQLRTT